MSRLLVSWTWTAGGRTIARTSGYTDAEGRARSTLPITAEDAPRHDHRHGADERREHQPVGERHALARGLNGGRAGPGYPRSARSKVPSASSTSDTVTSSGGIQRITWWCDAAGQQQQAVVGRAGRDGFRRGAVRLARRAVPDELDADHQPRPADVADPGELGHQLAQAAGQLRAAEARVGDEPLGLDRLEHGDARGARNRVAAVRRAVGAAAPALLELLAGDDRRQREAVRDRLRGDDDVRDDARVLERPHLARAREARLHLVGDEQDPVLVAQGAQLAQEPERAPGCSRPRPGRAR